MGACATKPKTLDCEAPEALPEENSSTLEAVAKPAVNENAHEEVKEEGANQEANITEPLLVDLSSPKGAPVYDEHKEEISSDLAELQTEFTFTAQPAEKEADTTAPSKEEEASSTPLVEEPTEKKDVVIEGDTAAPAMAITEKAEAASTAEEPVTVAGNVEKQ